MSPYTLTIATTAKISNATTCPKMSAFCSFAEMSVPSTHSHVISMISSTANVIRTQVLSPHESSPTV